MRLVGSKPLLAAGVVAALPQAVMAQPSPHGLDLGCIVTLETDEGEWVASRGLTAVDGKVVPGRDSYDWKPNERTTSGAGMTMRWGLSYDWPTNIGNQARIAEQDVVVLIWFRFEPEPGQEKPRNPQRNLLHLYRSTDPSQERASFHTSMSSIMLWHQFRDGLLQTKAVIPLDHLLAFGQGFDQLVWNIRSEPDSVSGGSARLAAGVLSVAAMRGKIDAIPKLRRALDRKAADYRKQCHPVLTVTVSQ
jgi:hypothetical protein